MQNKHFSSGALRRVAAGVELVSWSRCFARERAQRHCHLRMLVVVWTRRLAVSRVVASWEQAAWRGLDGRVDPDSLWRVRERRAGACRDAALRREVEAGPSEILGGVAWVAPEDHRGVLDVCAVFGDVVEEATRRSARRARSRRARTAEAGRGGARSRPTAATTPRARTPSTHEAGAITAGMVASRAGHFAHFAQPMVCRSSPAIRYQHSAPPDPRARASSSPSGLRATSS
jgi:hypothetical protein